MTIKTGQLYLPRLTPISRAPERASTAVDVLFRAPEIRPNRGSKDFRAPENRPNPVGAVSGAPGNRRNQGSRPSDAPENGPNPGSRHSGSPETRPNRVGTLFRAREIFTDAGSRVSGSPEKSTSSRSFYFTTPEKDDTGGWGSIRGRPIEVQPEQGSFPGPEITLSPSSQFFDGGNGLLVRPSAFRLQKSVFVSDRMIFLQRTVNICGQEDGAEILWTDRGRMSAKRIKKLVKNKRQLAIFNDKR